MSERFFIDVEMWDSKTRMYMDDLQLQRMWEKIHGLEPTPPPEDAKGPATEEELLKIQGRLTVDRLLSDFGPDTSYYEFPGGIEVRQISAHLASFPAQIVQYAARSGRMDGRCKSEELSDRIRDFEKIRDFATWEIERLGDL